MNTARQIDRKQLLADMRSSALRYRYHIHPQSQHPGYFSHHVNCAARALLNAITYRNLVRKGGE